MTLLLLIHLLLSAGSVECTALLMFTIISCFQKSIKGGWNKSGGLENFQKSISGGDDYLLALPDCSYPGCERVDCSVLERREGDARQDGAYGGA